MRSAAEMPVVTPSRASMDSQKAVPKFDVLCGDISGRRSASQRSAVSVRQIRPAAVGRHEIDDFRGDLFGGDGQVAFVLAVFIVNDDQHAPGANFLDRFGNGSEWHQ